jgi:hypothetical protein
MSRRARSGLPVVRKKASSRFENSPHPLLLSPAARRFQRFFECAPRRHLVVAQHCQRRARESHHRAMSGRIGQKRSRCLDLGCERGDVGLRRLCRQKHAFQPCFGGVGGPAEGVVRGGARGVKPERSCHVAGARGEVRFQPQELRFRPGG